MTCYLKFLLGLISVFYSNTHGWSVDPVSKIIRISMGIVHAEEPGTMRDRPLNQLGIDFAIKFSLSQYHVNISRVYKIHGPCNCPPNSTIVPNINASLRAIEELILIDNVDFILGTACSVHVYHQANLALYYNKTLISGDAINVMLYQWQVLPNAARFCFSSTTIWNMMQAMCIRYNWTHVTTIYDDTDLMQTPFNTDFVVMGQQANPPISVHQVRKDDFYTREELLQHVSENSRIVALLIAEKFVRPLMLTAYKLGMTDGSYAFFLLDAFGSKYITGPLAHFWSVGDNQDENAKQAYGALQVFGLDQTNQSRFSTSNFKHSKSQLPVPGYTTMRFDMNYFPVMHTNAILAVSQAMRTLAGNASSGTVPVDFVQRYLWNHNFEGAIGPTVIDADGQVVPNLVMYDIQDGKNFIVSTTYYNLNKSLTDIVPIKWPGPVPPADQPECGFDGTLCKAPTQFWITQAATSSSVAIFFVFCLLGFYAASHARRQIRAQLSWLVSWNDLTVPIIDDINEQRVREEAMHMNEDEEEPETEDLQEIEEQDVASFGKILPYGIYWHRKLYMARQSRKYRLHLNHQIKHEVYQVSQLKHDNIVKFEGACLEPDHVMIIYEYCSKGSLQDMLLNTNHKLDWIIRFSLLQDLVKGLGYVHQSSLVCHGRLKSRCCYIDSSFSLKIADYGLHSFFQLSVAEMWAAKREQTYFQNMFWTAPELLRLDLTSQKGPVRATKTGDIYSLSIILQEAIDRLRPYGMYEAMSAEEIIQKIKASAFNRTDGEPAEPFRSTLTEENADSKLIELATKCWAQNPADRPNIVQIKVMMRDLGKNLGFGEKGSILDTLLDQMDELMINLNAIIEERSQVLLEEKMRSDRLLYDLLPRELAEYMKKGEKLTAETFYGTIMMVCIDNYATVIADATALQITEFALDFHDFIEEGIAPYDCHKTDFHENMGMVAALTSVRSVKHGGGQRASLHACEIARAALKLLFTLGKFTTRHRCRERVRLVMGINSGGCVGGVVGSVLPRYCLFGETCQIATRMLETAEALHAQCSTSTKHLLTEQFQLQEHGEVFVKGKGNIICYTIMGIKDDPHLSHMQDDYHQHLTAHRRHHRFHHQPMHKTVHKHSLG